MITHIRGSSAGTCPCARKLACIPGEHTHACLRAGRARRPLLLLLVPGPALGAAERGGAPAAHAPRVHPQVRGLKCDKGTCSLWISMSRQEPMRSANSLVLPTALYCREEAVAKGKAARKLIEAEFSTQVRATVLRLYSTQGKLVGKLEDMRWCLGCVYLCCMTPLMHPCLAPGRGQAAAAADSGSRGARCGKGCEAEGGGCGCLQRVWGRVGGKHRPRESCCWLGCRGRCRGSSKQPGSEHLRG